MGRAVTIEDVAAAAGVSVATVSRALRDMPNVAESTRRRVRDVADQLAYVVDPRASRLAVGRTATIAIAVPVLDSWYHAKAVAGIEALVHEAGFDVSLYVVPTAADREKFVAGRGAWWGRCDAAIMIDLGITDAEADRLLLSGARLVTVGTSTSCFSSVTIDEAAAATCAIEHLLALGHRAIGLISGERHLDVGFRAPTERRRGVEEALNAAGVPLRPDRQWSGGFSVQGGREAVGDLLNSDEPPTAVFSMSDEMAFGAIDELRVRGRSCPDDLSIVGFDDHDISEAFGLTTMRQRVDALGAAAARLAFRSLSEPDAGPSHEELGTELVVRRSTGAPH